nr:unnamed protein product [Callosobruchus analis]
MAFKFVILLATLAYANAGFVYSSAPTAYSVATPGALTSQSSNIYRSFGNLGQISTYSKTVDTPYSSVSKSDVRVSNPGLRFATPALAAYAAPAVAAHTTYAAPAVAAHATYAAQLLLRMPLMPPQLLLRMPLMPPLLRMLPQRRLPMDLF